MEPGHFRSGLDFARWAGFGWKGKADHAPRTSTGTSGELGDLCSSHLDMGCIQGGVWKIVA